jgi:hypothetical protein
MLGHVRAGIRKVVNLLWSSDDILTDVVVSHEMGRTFDSGQGRNVATYSDVSVQGIVVEKARDKIQQENFVLQHESIDLLLRAEDLSSGLQLRDKVSYDGKTRQIKALHDYLGIAWGVTLEGS